MSVGVFTYSVMDLVLSPEPPGKKQEKLKTGLKKLVADLEKTRMYRKGKKLDDKGAKGGKVIGVGASGKATYDAFRDVAACRF